MTREEHLLTILAEECCEIGQRVSKALRFGLHEVQEGQNLNNAQRLENEIADFMAVYEMLSKEDILTKGVSNSQMIAKEEKVEKYLLLSEELNKLK